MTGHRHMCMLTCIVRKATSGMPTILVPSGTANSPGHVFGRRVGAAGRPVSVKLRSRYVGQELFQRPVHPEIKNSH